MATGKDHGLLWQRGTLASFQQSKGERNAGYLQPLWPPRPGEVLGMQGRETYADEFVPLLALCPVWMPLIAVQEGRAALLIKDATLSLSTGHFSHLSFVA